MKFFSGVVALAALVAQVAAQGQPTLNTPNGVSQCLNTVLTWVGGTPPYIITVNPGGQPAAAPLKDLGTQTGNSLSWKCDIAAGQSIFFRLRDSTGLLSETAAVTVLPGTDSVCLTAAPSSTSGGGAATTPTTGGAATTTPGGTTGGTTAAPGGGSTPGNTNTGGSQTTGAGTTAAPKPTGAANALTVNAGVAGIVALGAALLA